MLSRNSFIAPSFILMLGLITISGVAGATVNRGAHRNAPGAHSHAAPQPWYQTRRDVARRTGDGAPVLLATCLFLVVICLEKIVSTCRDELRDGQ
jgi:hypothetical protein